MLYNEDLSLYNRFNAICVSLKMIKNSKLLRTILLALTLGFFVVWVLEFRRAGLFESYWLLLLSITCLLFFQFIRLKAATEAKNKETATLNIRKEKAGKTTKK
jgi:hypothetical protein